MRKHIVAATLLVVSALVAGLLVSGCGGTTNRRGDAYKAVIGYTTALQKRDFYDACAYYSHDQINGSGAQLANYGIIGYSDLRACAVGLVAAEGQYITFFGTPIFGRFVIDKTPLSQGRARAAGVEIPKNGYVFRATYDAGVVYIEVQRDSRGDWKVVGLVAA